MNLSPTVADSGSIDGIEYEIYDFTALQLPDFIPGFYYSIGDLDGDDDGAETIVLEGPYYSVATAIEAATDFIHLADASAEDE